MIKNLALGVTRQIVLAIAATAGAVVIVSDANGAFVSHQNPAALAVEQVAIIDIVTGRVRP